MRKIRYLIDENVPPLFRSELLQQEPELIVWRIGDPGVPTEGTLDPEILEWCEKNDFILVTYNRKSMPVHLKNHLEKGLHIPGIIELNPNMGIRETIEELLFIYGASDADEYRDTIIYLPLE